MKCIFAKVLLTALVSIPFAALPAHAATKYVNCDEGDTIGHALETAKGSADQLDIIVTGTCEEEPITIRRDRVWITGENGAVINGTVRVFGASGIRLTGITITGPGEGLVVAGNGQASGSNLTLIDNEGDNLNVRRNAVVRLVASQIIGDCVDIYDEECSDGAVVDASTLELWNTLVSNARYGIVAEAGARVILDDRRGDNSKVFDNSVVGIQVAFKSLVDLRGTSHIHGNRYHGIYALQGSGIRIASPGVNVDDHIGCEDFSFLTNRGGGTINGVSCWMF